MKNLLCLAALTCCFSIQFGQSQTFVDLNATGSSNGSSWADAYADLGTALSMATSGDTIWIAEGTYFPGTNISDVFNLVSGITLFGGFDGNETSLSQRDLDQHTTILSGDIGTPGVSADNSSILMVANSLASSVLIDGFILEFANAGAVSMTNSTLVFRNVVFRDNSGATGAAVSSTTSELTLINCVISGNVNTVGGGTVFTNLGTSKIYNCIAYDNIGTAGSAFFVINGTQFISNCTVARNEMTAFNGSGGAVSTSIDAQSYISNSILWGNHYQNDSSEISQVSNYSAAGSTAISNCIIQNYSDTGVITGANITALNPEFVNLGSIPGLELTAISPAIDAGINDSIPNDHTDYDMDGNTTEQLPIDLQRNTRITNALVDLGANEWFSPLGIGEFMGLSKAVVYPNPSQGAITLVATLHAGALVKVRMLDIRGRTVLELPAMPMTTGNNEIQIEDKGLNGLHYLMIQSADQVITVPVSFH